LWPVKMKKTWSEYTQVLLTSNEFQFVD